jgi:secreted Zn-dependent insulinase-like peptidase
MAGVSEKYRGYQEFYIAAFLTDYGVLHYKEAILHMFEVFKRNIYDLSLGM